jgi:hypothetical protein
VDEFVGYGAGVFLYEILGEGEERGERGWDAGEGNLKSV